jgi:hypothetical protein
MEEINGERLVFVQLIDTIQSINEFCPLSTSIAQGNGQHVS